MWTIAFRTMNNNDGQTLLCICCLRITSQSINLYDLMLLVPELSFLFLITSRVLISFSESEQLAFYFLNKRKLFFPLLSFELNFKIIIFWVFFNGNRKIVIFSKKIKVKFVYYTQKWTFIIKQKKDLFDLVFY